jgi:hypothetical protein
MRTLERGTNEGLVKVGYYVKVVVVLCESSESRLLVRVGYSCYSGEGNQ